MTKRLITVGHSPDPDDAFMFYALAHDKLHTGDLSFRHELQDIETLNRRALRGELEVTQKGRVVDIDTARGPIRLRRSSRRS